MENRWRRFGSEGSNCRAYREGAIALMAGRVFLMHSASLLLPFLASHILLVYIRVVLNRSAGPDYFHYHDYISSLSLCVQISSSCIYMHASLTQLGRRVKKILPYFFFFFYDFRFIVFVQILRIILCRFYVYIHTCLLKQEYVHVFCRIQSIFVFWEMVVCSDGYGNICVD